MNYEFTRLVYRSRIENVFSYEEAGSYVPAADSPFVIKKFTTLQQIPASMHRRLFRFMLLDPMRRSLIRGDACVFVATIDDQLAGFAWTQSWDRFRSRYGKAFKEAIMLGPDWVDPKFRGRGLHPLLIRSRLDALDPSCPIVAVFAEGNTKSENGYKKNGFAFKQSFLVSTLFCLIHWSRCISNDA